MKLVTSEQMRQVDREAIDKRNIPGEQLMERAGRGIALSLLEHVITVPDATSVAVFCGKGNNGGDGYVIARYLSEAGVNVEIFYLGPVEKLSDDARLNYDRALKAGIPLQEIKSAEDFPEDLMADFVIDAIFGTGFSGAPRGVAGELIEFINEQDAEIVAVDMPSGLNADNGQFEGAVVQADYTFTLALPKYGLFVSPGRELAGWEEVVSIGIPDDAVESFGFKNELITEEWVADTLPERKPDGHKGTFGYLFVLAGSTGMTGAAVMTAMSALRTGCGLVRLGCPQSVQPLLATKLTEITTHVLPDVGRKGRLALRGLGEIRQLFKQNQAVVIGPGIGTHHETVELVSRLVSALELPSLIDADGLNCLAKHIDALKACPSTPVITPHPGEFKRLTGKSTPNGIEDLADMARETAAELGVVLVLKGSPTLVTSPEGVCYLNPTGNHGMATGGSGDVLSGIIGSLLAQGLAPLEAARAGVYLHGLAGDLAADALTPRAMIAGDMIDMLPRVFEWLE
jgi:hydroxyethylthiazole kinase-like uncharacterized protein yjeF